MKRSEINNAIKWAIGVLDKNNFKLPHFAYWNLQEWTDNREKTKVIRKVMQGWDITDYGLDRFEKIGSVLFTIRNGDQNDRSVGTPYAEKLIILKEGQALPAHFHFTKTEDIINRGGGILGIKLYNSKKDKTVDYETPVRVFMDGIEYTKKPGETILIEPGNSVTLAPYMYHTFWAEEGSGDLITGEVSSINDDNTDNNFEQDVKRFSMIEEDEAILYPLCNEYAVLFEE